MKRRNFLFSVLMCGMLALFGCGSGGGGSDDGGTSGDGTSSSGGVTPVCEVTISALTLPGDARNIIFSGTTIAKVPYSKTISSLKKGTSTKIQGVPYGVYRVNFEYNAGALGWVRSNPALIPPVNIATAKDYVSLGGMKP